MHILSRAEEVKQADDAFAKIDSAESLLREARELFKEIGYVREVTFSIKMEDSGPEIHTYFVYAVD